MSHAMFDIVSEMLKRINEPGVKEPDKENEKETKLCFAFQNLDQISQDLLPKNPEKITQIDLTENNLIGTNDLKFLFDFPNLKTLILDKNQIKSNFNIPYLNNLTTLWVNHNKIENLSIFIQCLLNSCPNLTYLSMMNNKAAPSYFNGGSLAEYKDYRQYVISKLKNLQMLDCNEINIEERMQAEAVYGTGRLSKYNDFSSASKLSSRKASIQNEIKLSERRSDSKSLPYSESYEKFDKTKNQNLQISNKNDLETSITELRLRKGGSDNDDILDINEFDGIPTIEFSEIIEPAPPPPPPPIFWPEFSNNNSKNQKNFIDNILAPPIPSSKLLAQLKN